MLAQDTVFCDQICIAKPEMVVAGTVFADPSSGADGADNVEIEFVDANNGSPLQNPVTFPSGNFFVEKAQWPRLTFPFKVRLKAGAGNIVPMLSTVNREGSCNFCHPKNPINTADASEILKRTTGQIFVRAGE